MDLGELYDLAVDPGEFDDLWDSPRHIELKLELVRRSFDAHMTTMYAGPDRRGPM